MEAWRKAALCHVLLVLLIVASSDVPSVVGAGTEAGHCWKEDDGNHHTICTTAACKQTCEEHGHMDGQCVWKGIWLVCECLEEC
ncbi:hypothetical protein ACP4OV_019773 [Aristida adscensionis]